MHYYAISDTHGFFDPLHKALTDAGFFKDTEPKKLILCGDMMDRGAQAVEMQNFMLDLLQKDELIFIRGNHEDLMRDFLRDFSAAKDREMFLLWNGQHHLHNGTFGTACQLAGMEPKEVWENTGQFISRVMHSVFLQNLIPAAVDFYETERFVFTHGFIPCGDPRNPKYHSNWRNSSKSDWEATRWINGMKAAEVHGVREPDKTIVCGHWNASYGHCHLEGSCTSEFGVRADHATYYGSGVIGLDACVAASGFLNILTFAE